MPVPADELGASLTKRTSRLMYDAYMQEAISDALLDFWSRFSAVSDVLVAVFATGSTVAGWAVWQSKKGILVWGIFSGIATVLAVLSGTLQIPGRVKTQNELSSGFRDIGFRAEALFDVIRGLDSKEIQRQLDLIDKEYRDILKRTSRDIIMTKRWRATLQRLLNERMEQKGYVTHIATPRATG